MVSSIQKEKAERFLRYHQDKEILVLLNSWDAGSSKLIEACGYKAIATTSMGIAASFGYPESQAIQLSEMLQAITGIVNGVQVPVTAAGFRRCTFKSWFRFNESHFSFNKKSCRRTL